MSTEEATKPNGEKPPYAGTTDAPPTSASGVAVDEDPVAKYKALRDAVIRTGRSQQLSLPDLMAVLGLIDKAIEAGEKPPQEIEIPGLKVTDAKGKEVKPQMADMKMTSEGAPVYVPPAGYTAEYASPKEPPKEAPPENDEPKTEPSSTEPTTEDEKPRGIRRHR